MVGSVVGCSLLSLVVPIVVVLQSVLALDAQLGLSYASQLYGCIQLPLGLEPTMM